jgi:predicted RND superfamily exporter protein
MILANGTTALGFLGLTFSPSPPVRIVGYLAAAGISVSFILCMTLLPVLQARFDPWKPAANVRLAALDRLSQFVARRRTGLVVMFLLLALPAAWLVSRNVISDNVFDYFPSSHAFYRDTKLVEDQFSGVNEVLYSAETGRELGFFDADAVEALGRLSTWLARQPEVNRAISLLDFDVIDEARQEGRLQERLDFYRDRIVSSSDVSPLSGLAVSDDYSSSVVTVFLKPLNSAQLSDFDQRVHAWAADNLRDLALSSGGATLMFASLGQKNIRSMLTSLTLALLAAVLILGIVFRSGRLAWIGLVCNFLPILLVYSVWAIFSGQISIGAAIVMGMILGIVLDDTIYFLAAYRFGLRADTDNPVRYAMRRVGPALIATSVTLIAGLSMGLLSDFSPIWNMSALSVSIIGTALVVDLLLLPALLPMTKSNGGAV